jgi:UDP-N-acetylmuramoyl-L-alanyl-D-glutamate--2,6-diaminopimelate ligase
VLDWLGSSGGDLGQVNQIGNIGLRTLLSSLDGLTVEPDIAVSGIAYRSNRVAPGDAFFCIRGFRHDGHDFAEDALRRGASALVVQVHLDLDAPQVLVPDTRVALAEASASFFGRPSASLDLIGITGTNGKTTSTYLLDSIFRAAGRTTGLIGTVGTSIAGSRLPSAHTTPESLDLQNLFAKMLAAEVDAVSMEVSSHAIDLHRVDGCDFAAVAFTNLTQDHLDYHHTLEEYFSVKRRLFTEFGAAARVVNVDDALGKAMAEEIGAEWTVGRSNVAVVRSRNEELDADGSTFVLDTPAGRELIRLPLAGGYNINNALVAAGCALAVGIGLDAVAEGLHTAPQVPGRLERVDCGQAFSVVVDYAHTPDSLHKAINAVRSVTAGRVIVVFGCGGDRDPDKRPLMGAAAGRADVAVVTSDNPRSEDPVGIILQIEDGLRESGGAYVVEVDRRKAINRAIGMAQFEDCVLIAGKGHEDYQIFADRTVHFDDREVAREALGC